MNKWLTPILMVLAAGLVVAQPGPEPDGPDQPDDNQPEKSSSLKNRPDEDSRAEAWVRDVGGNRPEELSVNAGVLVNHVISDDGKRVYYYRSHEKKGQWTLYSAGVGSPERKIMDTGASNLPPLFLGDGRLVLVTRKLDLNDDGVLDIKDEASLVTCNPNGSNLHDVALLNLGELPVAVWRKDKEVLLSTPDGEGANGWIVSMNLVRAERERIVKAFSVELVTPDGKLLLDRRVRPPKEPTAEEIGGWGRPAKEPEDTREPPISLSDPTEHVLFDPKTGEETELHRPKNHSHIVTTGEGSFFGHQFVEDAKRGYSSVRTLPRETQLLVIDDVKHRDTLALDARYRYFALQWIHERGLLAMEEANLASRLILIDRSLKRHVLYSLDFDAKGFCASKDGLTVAWMLVSDTNKDGYLVVGEDESVPVMLTIDDE